MCVEIPAKSTAAGSFVERTEAGSNKFINPSPTSRQCGRPAVAPSPMDAATNWTIDVDSNMLHCFSDNLGFCSVPDYADTWICDAATRNLGTEPHGLDPFVQPAIRICKVSRLFSR